MPITVPNEADRDADWLAIVAELTQHLAPRYRVVTFGGAVANFCQRN
jgi:hypothetical protein